MNAEDKHAKDREFFLRVCAGNRAAAEWAYNFFLVCHYWDDRIDNDKTPPSKDDTNTAFWLSMVSMPTNRFYIDNSAILMSDVTTAILRWHSANKLEISGDEHDAHIAFGLRVSILAILHKCALLCGGYQHALEIGPEIERLGLSESLNDYLSDLKTWNPGHRAK